MSAEELAGGLSGGPRKSWLMRKRQEKAAMKEGLAEWQANPYFCAGRVTVRKLHSQSWFIWPCLQWVALMSRVGLLFDSNHAMWTDMLICASHDARCGPALPPSR